MSYLKTFLRAVPSSFPKAEAAFDAACDSFLRSLAALATPFTSLAACLAPVTFKSTEGDLILR